MELNKKQKDIIETKHNKVVVLASAAAGKTRTLTERVRYLVHQGMDREKIVVITFTRAAASEMSERLGEDGEGIFIGTVHSYATYLLFSGGITETADALENEDFDQLFELISDHREVIKPVDYLLLDEAQDSDEQQFEFILNYIKPEGFMFFGDLKQTIYSFAGSRPDILEEIADDSEVITMPLNQNYRNTREVFEFAKWIIKPLYYDDSIIMSDDMGKVETLEYSPDLISRVGRTIKPTEYGNWFFLGRTNAQVDTMKMLLEKVGVPCETFKRADFTSMSELNKRLRANTVKVLTIHTSKGLEAENVVVQGARYFSDEERRIAYVAATRAKKRLFWLNAPKKKLAKRPSSWI